jgi:hypothetical protein
MFDENNLRESLFNAEPLSADRQQRFREEVARIVEPPLPRQHRLYYLMAMICSIIGVFGAGTGVVFDAEHRLSQALLLLVLISSAGWVFYILRRGAEPLRIMQSMSKVLAAVSVILAAALIYRGLNDPSLSSILWALAGLLIFLMTSFINLWNRLLTAERRMREDVLRVEYRVAEMASRLAPTPKP